MRSWQVQEAKARFSELLEASLKDGPQVVTERGVETAVLVPIEESGWSGPLPRSSKSYCWAKGRGSRTWCRLGVIGSAVRP